MWKEAALQVLLSPIQVRELGAALVLTADLMEGPPETQTKQ